ncbi:kynureninase [Teratosphaeria nubilosa]|uniref:Kynureninase n=1 Tax=Teratosphaeria nubilosa TaxID=161662 RepID=A0A6G1LDX7_9PEZI|nr:kynureninase [Teratosphaeria nubilosa]
MSLKQLQAQIRDGQRPIFPSEASLQNWGFATTLDSQDKLAHLRNEFILPTKTSLKKKALDGKIPGAGSASQTSNGANGTNGYTNGHVNGHANIASDDDTGIYFVGNSLGPQPKAVRRYLDAQLETWASIGVGGHFSAMDESPLAPWQDMAEQCARQSADIVGASPEEIVIMNTLTANLHLMMASFYRPSEKRHKVILEWRPFPSDHYVIESQIQWHGLDPKKSMVQIQPDNEACYIPTEQILATIDEHAEETALLLLPGIQYYSGQLFDIPRITKYAQDKGIVVGWDLAHAAGNVELKLHDWNVDWACWCTYKYMNAGAGAIAGAFVHRRHGRVDYSSGQDAPVFRHRLTGWYGHDKSSRFNMDNNFKPSAGAAGFQLSNPSAIDLASLSGALSVFNKTTMYDLRSKSFALTAYAQHLLDAILEESQDGGAPPFRILTPRDPLQRGTQLSVLVREELMDRVSQALVDNGVVCDKRKPGVIRVAPVALYTRFEDVFNFMAIFKEGLKALQ